MALKKGDTCYVRSKNGALVREAKDLESPKIKELAAKTVVTCVSDSVTIESGAERVRIEAHGFTYEGAPFKYQRRCLDDLRAGYAALSEDARSHVDPLLEARACLAPLLSSGHT